MAVPSADGERRGAVGEAPVPTLPLLFYAGVRLGLAKMSSAVVMDNEAGSVVRDPPKPCTLPPIPMSDAP